MIERHTLIESTPTLRYGIVCELDEKTMRVRVRFDDMDGLTTALLPVLTRKSQDDKDYWMPDEGEEVAVLWDANGENGIILGALFNDVDVVPAKDKDKRKVLFKDKANFEYDRKSSTMTIDGGIKNINIKCLEQVNIHALNQVNIQSLSQVNVQSETTVNVTAPMINLKSPFVQVMGLLRCMMLQITGGSVPGMPSGGSALQINGGLDSIGGLQKTSAPEPQNQ